MNVTGFSVAGIETCIEVPNLNLVLDMGRCPRSAVKQRTVLLTHGHVDHCGAIVHHAAYRALAGVSPSRFIMPACLVPDVKRMFTAAERLNGAKIPWDHVPLYPGEEFVLNERQFIRSFETSHRVPSQGYTVWERKKVLLPEFVGRSTEDLAALSQSGVVLSDFANVPVLAYTGDTRVDVLDNVPDLRQAATVIMECSFLDEQVSVKKARERGHIHLDELVSRADQLPANLILCHFSARYEDDEVVDVLKKRLPPSVVGRVTALVGGALKSCKYG